MQGTPAIRAAMGRDQARFRRMRMDHVEAPSPEIANQPESGRWHRGTETTGAPWALRPRRFRRPRSSRTNRPVPRRPSPCIRRKPAPESVPAEGDRSEVAADATWQTRPREPGGLASRVVVGSSISPPYSSAGTLGRSSSSGCHRAQHGTQPVPGGEEIEGAPNIGLCRETLRKPCRSSASKFPAPAGTRRGV